MKKALAIILCMAVCLSLGGAALAASGEARPNDQQYGLENETNSAIVVENGTLTEHPEFGRIELAGGGTLRADAISGVRVTGADDASNAIYIASDDDDARFTIGGAEDFYEVEGIGSFNSVLETRGPSSDPDKECWYGVGVTSAGGWLTLDNVYIRTEGYRASALYTPSGDHETNLIVKNSVLRADGEPGGFMPDFKLIVGSSRDTLLLGEDIWLYNSAFIARDWGAISHDANTVGIHMYAVNDYAESYSGGYALYALNGIENDLYGCKFVSAQYGMFVMGQGMALLDRVDAADEAALAQADGCDFDDTLTPDGRTLVAGACNAVVFHVNGNIMEPGELTVRGAVLSTMPEDISSDYGSEMHFDLDSYLLSPVKYGESWFYMENCLGSLITTRSHGAVIRFEPGCELRPANGVLVQTMIAYDPGVGNIFRDAADSRELKDVTICIDAPVSGDILHQDYQRDMHINVASDYRGRVTTGSITAWNALWSPENLAALLEQGGHSRDFELDGETVQNIRSCLVREEDETAYTARLGAYMTVSDGGVWTVEGRSSLLSLTVEDGGAVAAAEAYVGCAFGADGYLDPATGTKLDALTAGRYENVVLTGADEALGAVERGGELYVPVESLRELLGGGRQPEAVYGCTREFDEETASPDAVNLATGEMELDGAAIFHWEGSAVQDSGRSSIVVRNSYIRGDTEASTEPLAGNPGNLLVAGSIRTTLALGQSQAYYINSTIVSRNWAALSTDGAEPALEEGEKELSLYAYGSDAVTQDGGYGAYSDLFCNLYCFGSRIRAAEIGIISGTYGAVTVGTLADGEENAELAARLTDADRAAHSDGTQGSVVEGGRNALMIHSVNLPPYWAYEGYSQAELPLYSTPVSVRGSILRTDLSLDGNVAYEPQKQAYIDHTAGSVVLIKSTNVDMTVEDSVLAADPAGTGYIIQSVYNNDTMFMNAVPDGEQYPGIRVTLRNMSAEGGISHEDYQRDMYIRLENCAYTGAANGHDCAHWNAAGAAEGFDSYCLDADYAAPHGLYMTLADGASWTVTGRSELMGLTIGEGCELRGTMTVDGAAVEPAPGEYSGQIVLKP